MCTAGGASPEYVPSGRGQPQGSELAFCTEMGWLPMQILCWRGEGLWGKEQEGVRGLVSMNAETCGVKSTEGLQQLFWPFVFLAVEAVGGLLQSRPLGTLVIPTA